MFSSNSMKTHSYSMIFKKRRSSWKRKKKKSRTEREVCDAYYIIQTRDMNITRAREARGFRTVLWRLWMEGNKCVSVWWLIYFPLHHIRIRSHRKPLHTPDYLFIPSKVFFSVHLSIILEFINILNHNQINTIEKGKMVILFFNYLQRWLLFLNCAYFNSLNMGWLQKIEIKKSNFLSVNIWR